MFSRVNGMAFDALEVRRYHYQPRRVKAVATLEGRLPTEYSFPFPFSFWPSILIPGDTNDGYQKAAG